MKKKVQSVEPNITELGNGWLKSYKLNYKLEQESLNTEIDKALNNYFSKNLKYIRKKKNIDQQVMAEDLGVAQSTLSCWENGIRTPKIEQILDIANYFNVKIDIVSRDYSQDESNSFDEYAVLFDKYKELSNDDKELIKNIIETRKKQIDKELKDDEI